MIRGTLQEILNQLSTTLDSYPRKTPGTLELEGRLIRYADLHSFYHQSYQLFGQALYDFTPKSHAPYIVDCGAHIGLASLFFKTRHPTATISAFEADPEIFSMLQSNINSFGLQGVTCHQKAVWTHNDGVTFTQESDDSGSIASSGGTKNTVSVPSVRLKDVLLERPVDLLKVDIEGAEFESLTDAGDALRNVKALIVEVHLLEPSQKLHPLLQTLDQYGFRYVLHDLHHAAWLPPHEVPPFSSVKVDRWLVTVFAWRS